MGWQDGGNVIHLKTRTDRVDADEALGCAVLKFCQGEGNAGTRLNLVILSNAVFQVEAGAINSAREGFFDLVAIIAGDIQEGAAGMHAPILRQKQ